MGPLDNPVTIRRVRRQMAVVVVCRNGVSRSIGSSLNLHIGIGRQDFRHWRHWYFIN
jgi:hypothetical protein